MGRRFKLEIDGDHTSVFPACNPNPHQEPVAYVVKANGKYNVEFAPWVSLPAREFRVERAAYLYIQAACVEDLLMPAYA